MTPTIHAGLGEWKLDPSREVPQAATNSSRIYARNKCGIYYQHVYDTNRKRIRGAAALDIGTAWHKVRELMDANPAPDLSDLCETAQAEADAIVDEYIENGWEPADPRGYARSVVPMIEILAREPRAVRILETEAKFWMEIGGVLVLGTFDSIFVDQNDKVWVGEIKTTSADTSKFLSYRETHPQHILYSTAAKAIYGDRFAGTRYELLVKNWYPVKAGRSQTLEERLDIWPNTVHIHRDIPYAPADDCAVAYARFGALGTGHVPLPNHNSCMTFGRPACEFFKVCHEDYPLDGLEYEDRAPDYVDAAWEKIWYSPWTTPQERHDDE